MKKDPRPAGDPAALLLGWFAVHRRDLPWRQNRSLYRVWVAEVMLQQTRVETVVPYYRRFLRRFPTLKRLAEAPLQDVLKAWEELGYYSRANNFWQAARLVRDNFHGRIPGDYGEFRKLLGVGDYIAAAVLSIGCGLAFPVVDGNVLRVVCRLRSGNPRTGQPHAWVKFAELRKYPFPAANHKFFAQLKEYLDSDLV